MIVRTLSVLLACVRVIEYSYSLPLRPISHCNSKNKKREDFVKLLCQMTPHSSSEHLLQLLQHFIKHTNQIKQIHSLLITNSHLLSNISSNTSSSSSSSFSLKCMNTLLYNTLIRAYFNIGQPHKAILLFTHMLAHQAKPNNYTFPSLIKAATSSPSLASFTGIPIHTQAVKRGVLHDLYIQTSLVKLYAQFGKISDARSVFDEITDPCMVSCNAMLDALGKNGDMGSAVLLFERMPKRDVVSWTSIVNGFGANGMFYEAIKFFEKMVVHEDVLSCMVKPNEATFVSVLSSCSNLDAGGALQQGKQIHGYVIRNEIELTVFMATGFIALYGKTGCLGSATKVFNKTRVRAVCAWNAMISSLASNGREKQALDLFEKMKLIRLTPNEVTFVTVLTACARAQLVDLGLELFKSMYRDFGVLPRMEHYGCVVDLLARAGLLSEATAFMRRMPFEPDATVLGALLGACRVYGAVELGNEIGRRLLELQPWHCGRYVVLSSIHANAERWSHAADLRKAMLKAGIRKIPAYSSVDSM